MNHIRNFSIIAHVDHGKSTLADRFIQTCGLAPAKARHLAGLSRILIERHGGPEALAWRELPDPQPGPGEVLVRVRACGLNRLDLWVRDGVPGHRFPLPLVPGSDIAGVVAMLCSPDASYVTGQVLVVDGGLTLQLGLMRDPPEMRP